MNNLWIRFKECMREIYPKLKSKSLYFYLIFKLNKSCKIPYMHCINMETVYIDVIVKNTLDINYKYNIFEKDNKIA